MMDDEKIIFCGLSDMGRLRTNNEDAFVVERLDKSAVLAVAIDGVGGYEGGEVAAAIAQTEIPKYLRDFCNGERLELLKQAVAHANNEIFERRQLDAERSNMSCVLTSALIDTDKKVIDMVHVGDTRLYQFHHGELRKLSHDHSLVGYREEVGDLTEEQAMNHPQRNVISRDVGSERHEVSDRDFIEAEEFPLMPNTTLLLCSDGLTDLITSKQIVSVLEQPKSLEEKCKMLVDSANDAGGKDNVTVVLVEYRANEDEIETELNNPIVAEETEHVPEQECLHKDDEQTGTEDNAVVADGQDKDNAPVQRKKCGKKKLYMIAGGICAVLLAILLCLFCLLRDRCVSHEQCVNMEVKCNNTAQMSFMYDTNSTHLWSSYLSDDSNYVLRLEQLYNDSLGCAYRAILYDRHRFNDGIWVCHPLDNPAYVGYGSIHIITATTTEMAFVNGIVDSDDTQLCLYCDADSDYDILAVRIPYSIAEKDTTMHFEKYPWTKLKQWWINPMCMDNK